jgi:hypothetical protein
MTRQVLEQPVLDMVLSDYFRLDQPGLTSNDAMPRGYRAGGYKECERSDACASARSDLKPVHSAGPNRELITNRFRPSALEEEPRVSRSTTRVPATERGGTTIDRSGSRRLNVTEDVTGAAQEYDAVSGRIASVPFEFVVWNLDFRSDIDVRPLERFVGSIIRDGGVGLAVSDMDLIGPIRVGLAAT